MCKNQNSEKTQEIQKIQKPGWVGVFFANPGSNNILYIVMNLTVGWQTCEHCGFGNHRPKWSFEVS